MRVREGLYVCTGVCVCLCLFVWCVFTFFLPYVLLCASASLCESACVSFNVSTCSVSVCLRVLGGHVIACSGRHQRPYPSKPRQSRPRRRARARKASLLPLPLRLRSLFVSFFNLKALHLDLYPSSAAELWIPDLRPNSQGTSHIDLSSP